MPRVILQRYSLRIAIHEVEIAEDDFITAPHKGTFKEEITEVMHEALNEHGPLHRSAILEKVQERSLYVGGGVRTVGAYLSSDDRFKNVGKGIWALVLPPEDCPRHGDSGGNFLAVQ